MKTSLKASIAGLAFAAGLAAVPAGAQSFGIGIGPGGGISFSVNSGGYCDAFGCPDQFWNLPVYYGQVYYAGRWYDGPVYYRVWHGQRQYWVHGGWHADGWHGRRPIWWHEGRYGPALGMDYYRSHGFHGRWDNDRGFNQRHDGHTPFDNRNGNLNRRGDGHNAPHAAAPAAHGQTNHDQTNHGQGNHDTHGRGNPPAKGPTNGQPPRH